MAKKVVRRVTTLEGARFFGQPIGTVISVGRGRGPSGTKVEAAPSGSYSTHSITVKKSNLEGPKKVSVGDAEYGVPEGTRVFRPKKLAGQKLVFPPSGGVHLLDDEGEIELTPKLEEEYLRKYEEGLENNPDYDEDDGVDIDSVAKTAYPATDYRWEKRDESAPEALKIWKQESKDPKNPTVIQAYLGYPSVSSPDGRKVGTKKVFLSQETDSFGVTRLYYLDSKGVRRELRELDLDEWEPDDEDGEFFTLTPRRGRKSAPGSAREDKAEEAKEDAMPSESSGGGGGESTQQEEEPKKEEEKKKETQKEEAEESSTKADEPKGGSNPNVTVPSTPGTPKKTRWSFSLIGETAEETEKLLKEGISHIRERVGIPCMLTSEGPGDIVQSIKVAEGSYLLDLGGENNYQLPEGLVSLEETNEGLRINAPKGEDDWTLARRDKDK